ncbi:PREDICTED: PBAN-type neuropeptides-like [Ceratosolen solmsi marchali]|uniref:PBAN-type neuropeptides-like n=1 Tax=Ceratosolen solmsi marchali TaxID=326594 RepID=A0AAJ6YI73_9HYME|nr:PREDICTED: PBAN-type neuropeptides-like [Ceratosolen solmsi marchali]
MIGTRARTIVCGLVIVIVSQVAGEYEGQSSEVLESPRLERMHSERSNDCVGNNCIVHHAEGALGAIWFGPRLGRRRRSDAKYSGKTVETLGEVLGVPSLNLVGISDAVNKRQELAYSRREGREFGNNYSTRNLVRGLLHHVEEQPPGRPEHQLTLPMIFTPRLGRSYATPTLEREIHDLLRKLQLQAQ